MSSGGRVPRQEGRLSRRREPYRKHDSQHQRSGRSSRPESEPETDDVEHVKVSGQSSIKAVAGKLAHCIRRDDSVPTVLTIGAPSINLAVKAIAVARKFLAGDDKDILCQPAFREGMNDSALALYLTSKNGNRLDQDVDAAEFPVKEQTERQKLAGAIAGRVREKEPVYLLAHGAEAVANALSAICHARMFLEADDLDVLCTPKFIELENEGKKSTYLRIDIRPTTSAQ